MNVNLFGQSLLTILAMLCSGLTCFIVAQMRRKQALPYLLGISILVGFALQSAFVIVLGSSASELPYLLWLIITPWAFSIALFFGVWKLRRRSRMSHKKFRKTRLIYLPISLNILSCLALALVLVNGYYHFYPTLNSLIGNNSATIASLSSNGRVILQYNGNGKPITANSQTLEDLLYNSTSSLTDGRLYNSAIPGTISKFHARNAWIYAPAVANNDGGVLNLPVLVLLSGFPGSPTDWLHGINLVNTMNTFAKQHHGITPLVFVPDDTGSQFNDTECVNSPRGNVETYLTQDVPNYIKAHFPAANDPSHWAIGGLSMGGTCAAMLSLLHPNVYHYFLDIGGESGPNVGSEATTIQLLFHGSIAAWQTHQPGYLLTHHAHPDMGGFFASGNADDPTTVSDTRQLYLAAKQAGLTTVYETVRGPHTFNVFSQIFKDALPWVSNRTGATSCAASVCS